MIEESIFEKVSAALASDTVFVEPNGDTVTVSCETLPGKCELSYTIRNGAKVLFVLSSLSSQKARTFEDVETLIVFLSQMIKLERLQLLFTTESYLYVSGDSPYLQIEGVDIYCDTPGSYRIEVENLRSLVGLETVIALLKGVFAARKNPVPA